MTTETWSPTAEQPNIELSIDKLRATALTHNWLTTSPELNSEQLDWIKTLMRQPKKFWQPCTTFETEQLKQLIYFFTQVEEKYSECEAGNDSPVIALNKMLKQKNTALSKEDLLWIKQNSRNKFLPNGSIF